jgi:hypothetical protein
MFGPMTEVSDARGNRISVAHVVSGAALLARSCGKLCTGRIERVGGVVEPLAVTLVLACGHRLSVAGKQKIFARTRSGRPCWKTAASLEVGAVLYTVTDGILTVDRLVCTVHTSKPGEPWTTIRSNKGSIFAEEILCRAN